jgi:hypothetical protein
VEATIKKEKEKAKPVWNNSPLRTGGSQARPIFNRGPYCKLDPIDQAFY